jgi:hypothetical protein
MSQTNFLIHFILNNMLIYLLKLLYNNHIFKENPINHFIIIALYSLWFCLNPRNNDVYFCPDSYEKH